MEQVFIFLDVSLEYIQTGNGSLLVRISGYTFAKLNKVSNTWTCSRRLNNCKAKLKIKDGLLCDYNLEHNHDPPNLVKLSNGTNGVLLARVNGYTFGKINKISYYWKCSSRTQYNCEAKIRIKSDTLSDCHLVHNHDPPRYMMLKDGSYIRIIFDYIKTNKGSILARVNGYTFGKLSKSSYWWGCSKRTNSNCKAKLQIKSDIVCSVKWDYVKTTQGYRLILIDGYMFAKANSGYFWRCSSRLQWKCKAKVRIKDDVLMAFELQHTHAAPKYISHLISDLDFETIITQNGTTLIKFQNHTFAKNPVGYYWTCSRKKAKKCQAKVRVKDGMMTNYYLEHNHPPPILRKLSDEYKYITVRNGSVLLMLDSFTYSRVTKLSWYCSSKSRGCKAKVHLQNAALSLTTHNHPPPKYVQTSTGYTYITLHNGSVLLMIDSFTYSKVNKLSWYCSSKSRGCKARVSFLNPHLSSTVHNHPPPKYMKISTDFHYELIPSSRSTKNILVFQGYTFSQNRSSGNWYCSKQHSGCKARINMNADGNKYLEFSKKYLQPMKTEFNEKLSKLIGRKKSNSIYYINEARYEDFINDIKEVKNRRLKTYEDYKYLANYEVLEINGRERLVKPKNDSEVMKFYVKIDELFGVLHTIHILFEHANRDTMDVEIKSKYCNISKDAIKFFLYYKCRNLKLSNIVTLAITRLVNTLSFTKAFFTKSQKGKPLLLFGNYSYCKQTIILNTSIVFDEMITALS
ncbi:unnamed protein product, partial [Leptidea sinapis]